MSSAIEKTSPGLLTPTMSRAIGDQLGDPDWMAALRSRAASVAASLRWPTTMERPWKYLDVSALDLDALTPAVAATSKGSPDAIGSRYSLADHRGSLLVQSNGETVLAESRDGAAVVDFVAARGEHAATVRANLATAVPVDRSRFTALHYAFLRGGVLVAVPANAEPGPVRIVRDLEQGEQFAAPHTLVVTGPNSRVSVIDEYRSGDGELVVVPAVELIPGPGATIRYTQIHRWGAATRVFGEQRAITATDSSVVSMSVVVGGSVVKFHIESSLAGRGSSSQLFGLGVGTGHEHVDFFTLQDHIAPDTRSDLLFKSALRDHARSVYYGLTRVGLGARNADANQESRNLLLSRNAKADSDPVLEILTNDIVRASHGATAGPVDEEQLFYLQARGLRRPEAEALLVRGFLAEALDRVDAPALRDELSAIIEDRLEQAE